jgi:hypothetical protein
LGIPLIEHIQQQDRSRSEMHMSSDSLPISRA